MNLEIPGELITKNANEINLNLLNGKVLVGLCGYARSGKDTIGQMLVKRLGFKRISFGDMLKQDLNDYMRPQVFEDLQTKGIDIAYNDIDFLNPSTLQIKEILRKYMIWYGEKMKKINGIHHWTNRAFQQINPEDAKIVITDVRRPNELEIFRNNRTYIEKCKRNRRILNLPHSPLDDEEYDLKFETLLFYITQLHNRDEDNLTIETVLTAMEEWLFDEIIEVDSRIQDTQDYRNRHILQLVRDLANKYPQYLI